MQNIDLSPLLFLDFFQYLLVLIDHLNTLNIRKPQLREGLAIFKKRDKRKDIPICFDNSDYHAD